MQLTYQDIVLDDGWGRTFKWFLGISVLFHILVIYFGVIILPGMTGPVKPPPDMYKVKFITLPPAPAPATVDAATVDPAAMAPVQPTAPAVETTPPDGPTELVPVGPVEQPEPEIKKLDTTPPEPDVQVDKPKPVEKPKPKPVEMTTPVEKPKPKPVEKPKPKPAAKKKPKPKPSADKLLQKRMAKLQEDLHLKKRMEELAKQKQEGRGDSTSTYGVPGGRKSNLPPEAAKFFAQLMRIVQYNWRPPPESLVDKSKKLVAVYRIQVAPSGNVVNERFKKASGHDDFDQAVRAAIRDSNLPKLPAVFEGRTITIDLYFSPEGVQQSG